MKRTLVAALLLVAGCPTNRWAMKNVGWNWVNRADAMSDVAAGPLTPPPGRALVVFVRPSDFEGGVMSFGTSPWLKRIGVYDERGQFLGEVFKKTHFVVEVAPGPHLFAAFVPPEARPNDSPGEGDGVHGLAAQLAEGHIYFVEVGSYGVELLAVKPACRAGPSATSGCATRAGWRLTARSSRGVEAAIAARRAICRAAGPSR